MATVLELDVGDDNLFSLDANVALNAAQDKIWFTAKHRQSDADVAAAFQKGLNVAGLSGIVVTDAPNGLFQVSIPAADTLGLTVEALMYDVQIYRQATLRRTTLVRGVLRCVKGVTLST